MALSLIVTALATWRIAVLFFFDAGPWDIFARLRYNVGVYLPEDQRGFWARQLSCFYCLSLWSALFCTLVWAFWWYALIPFALSGTALLLSGAGRMIWHKMNDDG